MRTKFVDFLKKRPIFLSFLAKFCVYILQFIIAVLPIVFPVLYSDSNGITLIRKIFIYIAPTLFLVWFLKYKYIFFEHKKIEHKKANAVNLATIIFIGFKVLIIISMFVCTLILTPKLSEALFYFTGEEIFDQVLQAIIIVVAAPFAEEMFDRGIITNALADKYAKTKKGVVFCVLFSGLFFGLSHLTNVFSVNETSIDVFSVHEIDIAVIMQCAIQSMHAICVGLFFSALYLRKRNIYIPILLHSLNNMAGFLHSLMHLLSRRGGCDPAICSVAANVVGVLNNWIGSVLFVVFTWLVLRKNGFSEIIANFKKES